ncbi:MAG: FxsA family protein [Nitriliruptoraceae bacterium]
MLGLLALVFVGISLLEIVVISQVGTAIGAWPTITLLLAASVLGAVLLRREGARAWQQVRDAFQQGDWPGDAVAQGALVVVGGTLLVTPGFVTDAIGLFLLVRPGRAMVLALARHRLSGASSRHDSARRPRSTPSDVIDIEVVDVQRERDDHRLPRPPD